jgi:hypothetical protein
MEAVLFEVVNKTGCLLVVIVAVIWWFNAGQPMWTITRRR